MSRVLETKFPPYEREEVLDQANRAIEDRIEPFAKQAIGQTAIHRGALRWLSSRFWG
jgi:hypothetical protein